jgi:hypothetical protein
VRLAQHVAAAPYGFDEVAAFGGVGELLAQLADEDVDDLQRRLVHAAIEMVGTAHDRMDASSDGSVTVQFGACDGKIPNCLPIMSGWNYTVRLYRPRAEIVSRQWKFPEPQPVN